jgi:hypothetical protein
MINHYCFLCVPRCAGFMPHGWRHTGSDRDKIQIVEWPLDTVHSFSMSPYITEHKQYLSMGEMKGWSFLGLLCVGGHDTQRVEWWIPGQMYTWWDSWNLAPCYCVWWDPDSLCQDHVLDKVSQRQQINLLLCFSCYTEWSLVKAWGVYWLMVLKLFFLLTRWILARFSFHICIPCCLCSWEKRMWCSCPRELASHSNHWLSNCSSKNVP